MAITPTSLERVDHIHFPMKEAALLTNLSTNISRKNALDGSFAPESTTRQQSTHLVFHISSVIGLHSSPCGRAQLHRSCFDAGQLGVGSGFSFCDAISTS